MKFDHKSSYFYKYPADVFNVAYDFNADIDSADTISSMTATAFDGDGDVASGLISSVTASTPNTGKFTISSGTNGETYSIKLVCVTSNSQTFTRYVTCEVVGDVTLVTKLGAPTANSYVTLTEANEYIRNKRGHSNVWDTLSPEGKKRILIEACKDINRFNFTGEAYYDNQSLPFPDTTHETVTGNVATPLSTTRIKNTSLSNDTYGSEKFNHNYWQYGTLHITSATPLRDICNIASSNSLTDIVSLDVALSASPTTNTKFIVFAPLAKEIKYAQIEQTLFIVETEGSKSIFRTKDMGVEESRIGDVSVRFKKGSSAQKIAISPTAYKLMSRWFRKSLRVGRA
uniref:Putative DnaT-like domain-containing protein n=1 Tax=viral metagenome TaxID=1070528 RepID=A0A6M3IIX3_9ZZZZ